MTTRDRSRKARDRTRAETFSSAGSLLVHDIKNLSFRLGALLQNVQNNYEDPLFRDSVVEILSDTVEKMDQMVRRCRDRRDGVIIKYPIDLNEILDRIVEGIPERSGGQETGVFIEARYGRVPKIWGDPEFLGEALAIIIQNGLEAMEEGKGNLILETSCSDTRSGRKRVTVRIADTGCGMQPEFVRSRLFAPFVTTKQNGLGMGLYACQKIIALHEGTIRVSSRVGRGTTFRISFDAA